MKNNLFNYLESKPLFYKKIDYDLMPRVYSNIKKYLELDKVIHIIGTNGKGTTGRFLADYLYKLGFSVGHYSSPHIIRFNERIWFNSKEIDDLELNKIHNELQYILKDNVSIEEINKLSYFEYTTFLALLFFSKHKLNYVILEAGLGGEFDATNVVSKDLSLVTTIDFDHQDFLGNSIEEIAFTKLNSINNSAIIGKQNFKSIFEVAEKIELKKNIKIYKHENIIDINNTKKELLLNNIEKKCFLLENLLLVISAIKFLNIKYDVSIFSKINTLFGRVHRISNNITIDVGHNPLAANAIKSNFDDIKIVLIYNTFKDKDYFSIISILKPIIKRVEILRLKNNQRVESEEKLKMLFNQFSINVNIFSINNIRLDEQYLVFGSFLVVEEFLKLYEK